MRRMRPQPSHAARPLLLGHMANALPLRKHDHGQMFRAKIVPTVGPPEFGAWYASEAEVQAAMQGVKRALGKRYYCESMPIACAECEPGEQSARVIAML